MQLICIIVFWLMICFSVTFSKETTYSVAFHGNSEFSSSQLEEQMDLPGEFSVLEVSRREFLLKLARGNLEDFYLTEGYFSVQINLEEPINSDGDVIYPIQIFEGPKYTFRKTHYSIMGADLLTSKMDFFSVHSGDPFRFDQIAEDLQSLRSL